MKNSNGLIPMFVGALIMSIFLFIDMPLSFGWWAAGFGWGMLISAIGAILGIIHLFKKIKAESEQAKSK